MVSTCKKTSIKTPKKLFVRVPDVAKMRNKWFQLAHRNPEEISHKSVVFFCEDHFDVSKQFLFMIFAFHIGRYVPI